MADGSFLFALLAPTDLTDAGFVDNSDIVRLIPTTSDKNNIAGVFELYFREGYVDIGFSSAVAREKIDAIGFLPDERMVVSTRSSSSVSGVSSKVEDLIALIALIAFMAASLGEITSDTWRFISMARMRFSEMVMKKMWPTPRLGINGNLFKTRSAYSVPDLNSDDADIFRCVLQPKNFG